MSAGRVAATQVAWLADVETPIGEMIGGATDTHLVLLEFARRRTLDAQLERLTRMTGLTLERGESRIVRELRRELDEYFRGERKEFTIPIDARGTPFQMRVWAALRRIPTGTTTSYARLAMSVGQASAVRAVAGERRQPNRDPDPVSSGDRLGWIADRVRRRAVAKKEAARSGSADGGASPAGTLTTFRRSKRNGPLRSVRGGPSCQGFRGVTSCGGESCGDADYGGTSRDQRDRGRFGVADRGAAGECRCGRNGKKRQRPCDGFHDVLQ